MARVTSAISRLRSFSEAWSFVSCTFIPCPHSPSKERVDATSIWAKVNSFLKARDLGRSEARDRLCSPQARNHRRRLTGLVHGYGIRDLLDGPTPPKELEPRVRANVTCVTDIFTASYQLCRA